ncbi:TetR/AcrR family transcriptional regulator [Amycolatopsis rhabdoformis]|uniref:TetR/AcrR family transcriptional regulator n=1 Tax=Amycolatopsis rhabdoformis TaxID=1448059 RepID=A0ABZ1IM68_9PSEU|nr:TetR/AcrR family transcriptional regulator [Amycolatopsis rhabdoformis]WSE35323.1 TetR/AcrR family transcriptional regulator [Amycolatopsis rhabdoformis]
MAPDDRRRMIVRAVLPLVVEHGRGVTTAQIARAAGIGEGTIFRVFTDKDELFDACVEAALDPGEALEMIGEIPSELVLERRLAEAVEALSAHLQRVGAVMAAAAIGRPRPEEARNRKSVTGDSRRESMEAMQRAVRELFVPDADRLRLPVDKAASMFLAMLFARGRSLPGAPDTAELIDVFLHGAVSA